MGKQKTITCDKCKTSAICVLKWVGQGIGRVKCWDIPGGWTVTLPNGWLCPICK